MSSIVSPVGSLDILSREEVARLRDASDSGLHELWRRCSLAVLNGGRETDDALAVLNEYADFDIRLIQQERGIKLEVLNAPANAFVDDQMVFGVREHLFSILRDIVYIGHEQDRRAADLETSNGITDFVFHILRNSGALKPRLRSDVVVCWGGHSISREEYEYTKEVGYEMGLRELHICTGCGAGAMKGPMKGAAIGHLKQRVRGGRYIGLSEPGIIASESPNPMVNELIIMPDIEKRLEAFVRLAHAVVVFPGGVGTAEEIFYLLGILLHPENKDLPFPLIFTGPRASEEYFQQIDDFLVAVLGSDIRQRYQIIVQNPQKVATEVKAGVERVVQFRREQGDAFYFNWHLHVDNAFQKPFIPTHEAMAGLNLHPDIGRYQLAVNLRRVFSGIVAGNIKEDGVRRVQQHGPFQIHGDSAIMEKMDALLQSFIKQQRMKLPGSGYTPCYEVVK
ncbi:MAG: LOG family protein [Gammaproteobacteria bacterium]|nr:LOG family protein [Gammaproteobacteria bacterium]